MRISYPLFEFKAKAIALIGAAIIMVVLLAANTTITNAQQQQQQEQQQLSTSQPTTSSAAQNGTLATTTLSENTRDNFRVQLPEGWVIEDVNNTGFTLAAEVLQGYGILAQICPAGEEGQQQGALTNVSSSSSNSGGCQQQQAQEEIIHIIRYPNLGIRLGISVDDINDIIPDSILEYHIQKLEEAGYRDINLVNSTNTTININYTTPEDVPALLEVTIPARIVEMNYSTSSAPSEMRRGYSILTATTVTPPNPETITGYTIFYEGALGATAAEQTTTPSDSLPRPPVAVRQVLDSFELIASEETVQVLLGIIAQQAMGNEPNDQVEEDQAGEVEEDDEE